VFRPEPPAHPELVRPSGARARTGRAAPVALVGLLVAAVLSGCVPAGPDQSTPNATTPVGSAGTPSATTAPSPTATDTAPALKPDGTAADNLPYFSSIVAAVWAGPDNASGRAYIDALAGGGFDKAAMEVTFDQSTVGNPAESIQFSVLWAGECLVGQVGPATGSPVAVVLRPVGSDKCLIGETRPIDW